MRRWLTCLPLAAGPMLMVWTLAAAPVAAYAPAAQPPAAGGEEFKDERLEAEKPSDRDLREFDRMLKGTYPFDNPSEAALRDPAAQAIMASSIKYYIYRLTWSDVQEARVSSMSDVMEEILGGANNNPASKIFPPILIRRKSDDPEMNQRRERQMAYLRLAVPHVIKASQDVLRNKVLAARLNAARILERVADWGFDSAAEPLLNIMNHPQEHDAVRMWAMQGLGYLLREYSERGQLGAADDKGLRYQQCSRAIYQWLDKHASMSAEELEQWTTPEKDAIVYIRKRAIRALGMTRRAMIIDGGRTGEREGPVAELLAKIMLNPQGVVLPEASWSERVEAAYALSQMNPRLSPSLNMDVVAFQIGQFMASLGAYANGDPGRTLQRWKYIALQLKEGLDAIEKESSGSEPGQEFTRRLLPQMMRVVENLDDQSKHQQAAQDLFNYLSGNAPPGKTLFKPAS